MNSLIPVGSFDLVAPIGAGGMGTVWKDEPLVAGSVVKEQPVGLAGCWLDEDIQIEPLVYDALASYRPLASR